MASRNIDDLHIDIKKKCLDLVHNCKQQGIEILVICTYRSNEEQAALYAKGRTEPGPIRTNARPGQSLHNYTVDGRAAARAFDVVPIVHGKCLWETTGAALTIWNRIGAEGKALGLAWAGEWKGSLREFGHFQL